MKRLIVTADDFGLSNPVNEAVELAHTRGILTAASLMVTAPAAADAVTRARRLPELGVGLHLVFVDGIPALPPTQIPDLVGKDGRFHRDPTRFGVRLFFSPRLQHQVTFFKVIEEVLNRNPCACKHRSAALDVGINDDEG